jgi:hypothetical protein
MRFAHSDAQTTRARFKGVMFTKRSKIVVFYFFLFGLVAPFIWHIVVSAHEQAGFHSFFSGDIFGHILVPVTILGWLVMGENPQENLDLIIHLANGIFWTLIGISLILSEKIRGYKKWLIPIFCHFTLGVSLNFAFVCWSEGC